MRWVAGIVIIIGLYLSIRLVDLFFEQTIFPMIHRSATIDNKDETLNSEYHFVVTKKYLDSTNHNNETIVGKDFNNKNIVIYGSPGYWELYAAVSVGDTILKNKKSYIFKLNNGYKKIFDIGKQISSDQK